MKKISLDKPQIICHHEKSVNYSLFDCKWIPSTAKFVVMGSRPNGTGLIQMFEIFQGDVKLVKEIERDKAIKCGTFGVADLGNHHLATGDFDGRLNIYNVEKPEVPLYSVSAHKEIINAIDGVGGQSIGCGAPEIVTGSRDGSVKVWDPRQKSKPVAIMEPASEDIKRDCWTVAFGNSYNSEQRVVCAGYDNGDIKLFDLYKMRVRWEDNVKNGVCCVEFDRRDIPMNKLVVTTLESKIHLYNMKVQHPTKNYSKLTEKAHKATVWTCRHLPQNREIFMTGGAGTLCLWKYNYPEIATKRTEDGADVGCVGSLTLLQNATVATQPIAALDWSPDKQGLAVCSSYDQTFRVLIVTKLNAY